MERGLSVARCSPQVHKTVTARPGYNVYGVVRKKIDLMGSILQKASKTVIPECPELEYSIVMPPWRK